MYFEFAKQGGFWGAVSIKKSAAEYYLGIFQTIKLRKLWNETSRKDKKIIVKIDKIWFDWGTKILMVKIEIKTNYE